MSQHLLCKSHICSIASYSLNVPGRLVLVLGCVLMSKQREGLCPVQPQSSPVPAAGRGCRGSTPFPPVLWSRWMVKNGWRAAGALACMPGFVWESCPKTRQGKGRDDMPFLTDAPHVGHSLVSVAFGQESHRIISLERYFTP